MGITLNDQLVVVGKSGALLTDPIQPGDLLIRAAPLHGGIYSAVVLSAEPESREVLEGRGLRVEEAGAGMYVEVRELTADGTVRQVGRQLTDSWGRLPRGQSLVRAVDTRGAAEDYTEDTATPVQARILWPALGFPAVIAPKDPPSTYQMREADATRCITLLVISNRKALSKAEAAAGLRYVPWADRHKRHLPRSGTGTTPGTVNEVDLEIVHQHKLVMPTDDRNKPREDEYSKVFRFGANQEGERGITVSLAKYVRDFYSAQKMPFICEIRVSERMSGTLANGLYHLFWNNEQAGEDTPSDEMRLLLAAFAEPHQKRFNKYFKNHRTELLAYYEYEYGYLQPSFAFKRPGGRRVRQEVLHPLFVKRDLPRRLTIGHVTDIHVDVRNDVYEHNLQQAQVGQNFNNWNTSFRQVYEAAKGSSSIILLTGDLIDYGRGFWGMNAHQQLGQDSFYVVDRNWPLFYQLIAAGDTTYSTPVYTSLGNHDWRINPYPPFAPGGPGMLSMFHNRGQFTVKQRRSIANAQKEFVRIAHGKGHERGFSYLANAGTGFKLLLEKPWDSLKALWDFVRQKQNLDKAGTPVETTIDSVAWYLLSINPFLDYSVSLPSGHEILMLDWAENENVLFPIVVDGQEFPYMLWQVKEAADPGPKAGRALTPLQRTLVDEFASLGGHAKMIGIHAPPIGPYTDWTDVDLSNERKVYAKKKKNRGPTNWGTQRKDGTTDPWNGHPIFAITPRNASAGMQADYGSFDQHRDWFIRRMLEPAARGVRLIFSGHIHRNNLMVVHRGVGDPKISKIHGELLVRGVQPPLVRSARFPAVTTKGDIGPLYVNTTSGGPRGHWYPASVPDPKTVMTVTESDEEAIGHVYYRSVEPGFTQVELSHDGTIHKVEFRTATGVAVGGPVAAANVPRRAVG